MSLRRLQSTVTASCLVVTAVLSTASVSVFKSASASLNLAQAPVQATELAFRASGRVNKDEPVAYRASGRFNTSSFEHTLLSYRASERGMDTLAYRASGRFNNGFVGHSALPEAPAEQTVAYRASGRFNGGTEHRVISYRGSERGLEASVSS